MLEELTVDEARFDRWARTLGAPRSRRGALAVLAGGVAAVVGWRRVAAQIEGSGNSLRRNSRPPMS